MMKGALNQLWAPWRNAFVTGPRPKRCIFCAARSTKRPSRGRADHVVLRGRHAFVMLNRYPYSNGHVLVAPYRHVARVEALRLEEWVDLWGLVSELIKRLQRGLRPHGFNVGLNLGKAAGAGIVGHLHLHVVPRWHGDTNFMPVLTGTKIVPQSLEHVSTLLRIPSNVEGRRPSTRFASGEPRSGQVQSGVEGRRPSTTLRTPRR